VAPALVLVMVVLFGQLPASRPLMPSVLLAQGTGGSAAPASPLDYDVFKAKVQPILISPRKGNARCSACHAGGGGNSYLEPLPPGSETYTEEQSRRNFARVARLVVPGEPLKSLLLINPLDHEVGGSEWHGGGKHWHSQDDPECKALAAWVSGN
jgi:hypothetical protein